MAVGELFRRTEQVLLVCSGVCVCVCVCVLAWMCLILIRVCLTLVSSRVFCSFVSPGFPVRLPWFLAVGVFLRPSGLLSFRNSVAVGTKAPPTEPHGGDRPSEVSSGSHTGRSKLGDRSLDKQTVIKTFLSRPGASSFSFCFPQTPTITCTALCVRMCVCACVCVRMCVCTCVCVHQCVTGWALLPGRLRWMLVKLQQT